MFIKTFKSTKYEKIWQNVFLHTKHTLRGAKFSLFGMRRKESNLFENRVHLKRMRTNRSI